MTSRTLPTWQVEEAIEDVYRTVRLGDEFTEELRADLHASLDQESQMNAQVHTNLGKELTTLDQREQRLLDLAEGGSVATESIRQRLRSLQLERVRITETMQETGSKLELGAQAVLLALTMLENGHRSYLRSSNETRARLNRALYEAFYFDELPDAAAQVRPVLRRPFHELSAMERTSYGKRRRRPVVGEPAAGQATGTAAPSVETKKTRSLRSWSVSEDKGWSKQVLVREAGLEPARPRTPGPKPGAAASYATRARRTVYVQVAGRVSGMPGSR